MFKTSVGKARNLLKANSLDEQNKTFSKLLVQPLPLETDGKGFCGLYSFRVGSSSTVKTLKKHLDNSTPEGGQNGFIVAITQLSGVGKTKLCYDFILKEGKAVLIRFGVGHKVVQNTSLFQLLNKASSSIKAVLDNYTDSAIQYPVLSDMHERMLAYIQIYILVHLEVTLDLKEELVKSGMWHTHYIMLRSSVSCPCCY